MKEAMDSTADHESIRLLDRYAPRNENFVLVVSFVRRSAGYQGQSPWLVREKDSRSIRGKALLPECSRTACEEESVEIHALFTGQIAAGKWSRNGSLLPWRQVEAAAQARAGWYHPKAPVREETRQDPV
jgi:hypothetical protein